VRESLRKRAIARLEAIGLEPFAHEIVDMDPHPATIAEHIDWILTADASEIRRWVEQVFYR
jgi:hypothetical protein